MEELRAICVGTNFSPESEAAVQSAVNLARSFGATLNVVTVIEPPPLYQRILSPVQSKLVPLENLAANARQRLTELTSEPSFKGVSTTCEARTGAPYVEIITAARACRAGLLVVGAKHRGAVERLLLGHTTERVLQKASMPVLVAKKALPATPKVLLSPTDFSPSSRPAVLRAVELARRWEARLVLLHVVEPIAQTYVWPAEPAAVELFLVEPEDLKPEWENFLSGMELDGVRWEQRTLQGYAASTITATASEVGADLIVMGTHGRSGLMHALLGSIAERVAREAPCGVWSVHPKDFSFALP